MKKLQNSRIISPIIQYVKRFTRQFSRQISTRKFWKHLKRASIYEGYDDLQKIPNPLTYWRYYADNEMEVLPKVDKIMYHILASSISVCDRALETTNTFAPIGGCALIWGDLRS